MDKEVIDLINLGEFTNNFLNDNGKVTFNSYLAFWDSIPEKSTLYLAVLLTKILSIQNGEDKLIPLPEYVRRLAENTLPKELDGIGTARAIEIDEKGVEMHSRLLTTAYFISLFYSNSAEFQPFFTALARFNIFREAQKVRTFSTQLRSNEFLFSDEITRLHSTPNYLLSFDGLKFLIQQLAIIDFPADYNFKSMSSNYVAPSLVNAFLRRALLRMDRQFTNMLFDVTIDYFRHPSLSEEMVLALMHTFKTYLTAVPSPPTSLMKKAVERMKQYYLWPKPYSDYAKDVLDLITLEIRAPGAGYRSRYVEEFPHIIPHPGGSEYPITGRERTAYLIIDKDCSNAYAFSEILNTYKPRVPTDSEIRLGILSNIFIGCLNIDPTTLNLGYCNEGDIASLCTEAISIMNKTLLIRDEKEAEAFRTKELQRLKETIMRAPKNSQLTCEIVAPRVPLEFVTKVIDCSNESLKTQSYSSNNVRQYHLQRPSFQLLDEILGQVYNSLQDFNFITPARRPFVRIGIVGNDSTVHNIVSAYLGMRITRADYFNKLDVRFFLIPIDDCHLAGFMGRQDKWYGRQVACLTKCIFGLYPSTQGTGFINLDEEVAKVKAAAYPHPTPSPAYVLRTEIENYFREARWPLNMTIFQCECFKTVFETTSVVIPFSQRAEVGTNIANLSKDTNTTRLPPALLCLKFLHVNPVGVPRMSRPTEPRLYETISMSAVSWSPEEGKDAHPSRTWLEMYIRESDSKEKKKKERSTKEKSSSSKSKPEDSKKGKNVGRNYHVANVEIEPQDKTRTFEVMLDGIIYGPFAKIKIVAAADNATDTIYSFPMMSYLPAEEEEFQS